jgi:uncharacterized protein (TIGR03066 family)
MRVLGSVLAVCLVFVLLGEGRRVESQKDNAAKLLGVWKLVKSGGKEVPAEITIEFAKDGKEVRLVKMGDKEFKLEGTYKLDGDKITSVTKFGGKEITEVHTIQTLNDTTLITKDAKGEIDEFKRK